MALEDDIRTLSETPVLDELGRDALRLIAFSSDRVRMRQGDVLFREGDRADCAFVLVSGALSMERREEAREVRKGALIGELALICDVTRPATAVATESSEALKLDRRQFSRLLEEYPDLARKLHSRLSQRVTASITELRRIEQLLRR